MLLLHRILIQYGAIVHVNFNKVLETLICQRSYAQYLY